MNIITKRVTLLPAPSIGTRFTVELTDELDFVFWDASLAESSDAATIDWGDGCVESFNDDTALSHSYQNAGRYVIGISDDITTVRRPNNLPDASKIALTGLQSNARKLTVINPSTFIGCVNLAALDISGSAVETLGYAAFKGCVSLPPRIDLPNVRNLVSRGTSLPFSGCTSIRELHFSAANEEAIRALPGYDTAFGAVNAAVYCDL